MNYAEVIVEMLMFLIQVPFVSKDAINFISKLMFDEVSFFILETDNTFIKGLFGGLLLALARHYSNTLAELGEAPKI